MMAADLTMKVETNIMELYVCVKICLVFCWVSEVFVIQGSPFCFTGFCHPRVSPWVWKIVTKYPPLGLEDFSSPRIIPLILQVFVTQLSPLGFQNFFCYPWSTLGLLRFVTKGSPFCFTVFSHPKVPPWVWKIFITKGPPSWVLMVSSPKCPPLSLQGFCHQGSLLGFPGFSAPKGPPLGFGRLFVTEVPPLSFAG